MAGGFFPMGNVPEGYDSLLNAAQSQLVRMPDGTYQRFEMPPTTVQDAYRGMYATSPSAPLKTRAVSTVPLDANGNPIIAPPGFTAETMAKTRALQSGARPAITVGTQPAGTVAMPPGVRPASVPLPSSRPPRPPQVAQAGMFGRGNGGYWSGALKDQERLPFNDGGEAAFLTAFGPDAAPSPAVTAIDEAAGMPPLPRVRPIPEAKIPLASVVPPKPAGGPPALPAGAITFRKGDTVSALAKRLGMTTTSFSDLYGIANPNRIRAGDTVAPRAPIMPRMPPAGLMRSASSPPPVPRQRPRESSEQIWLEAKGLI